MRIGFLADLHYGIDGWVDHRVDRFLEKKVGPAQCDLLLIAGDVAEMADLAGEDLGDNHRRLLERARAVVACPIGFCAGNHDIWSSDPAADSWRIYHEVLPEAAVQTGTTCLDVENLTIGDLTVVGCYGHFDYSLHAPDLEIGGRLVTEDDYRRQTPPGYSAPVWMDGQSIHWAFDDPRACAVICDAAMMRLESALTTTGRKKARPRRQIVLLTHGIPRRELNGHGDSRDALSLFLQAFSGTNRLEAMVRRAVAAGASVLSVSGHTHKSVPKLSLDGADYLNVGGTYGMPRLVIEELGA